MNISWEFIGFILGSWIESHLKNLKGLQSIEMGCAVDYGSFYVNYEGDEDINNTNFGERILNYYSQRKFSNVTFSSKENSLVTFFLQLTRYLQQSIGTVAAIDLNAYAKSVGFEIDEKNIIIILKLTYMNKAVKYTRNGILIGGAGFGLVNLFDQLIIREQGKAFNWKEFFTSILKGVAIGGSIGLGAGVVKDYLNAQEEPINTDAVLFRMLDKVRLNPLNCF